MTALGSTTCNLSALAVTRRWSRGTTATCENSAPVGFQHLVHPHTWLWAHWPVIATATFLSGQWQTSVPPAKSATAGFVPRSTAGCMEIALVIVSSPFLCTLPSHYPLSLTSHEQEFDCRVAYSYPACTREKGERA